MSMSAPTRVPLGPLPLSRFVPSTNSLPSPISLPSKRHAPAASSSTSEPVKARKVSKTDGEGYETVKRSRVKEVTPKAKAVLERDDFGIGKSPARRLFVEQERGEAISGISGATTLPSTSPSHSRRSLAPSPPVESRSNTSLAFDIASSSFSLPPVAISDNIPIHNIGFVIYADQIVANASKPLGVGIGTPKSKRSTTNTSINPPSLALDAMAHIPSSASSSRSASSWYDDDQENIPPTWSANTTPSKHSARSTPSKTGGSEYEVEEEIILSSGGSGRKRLRKIERSKLGLESVLRGEMDGGDDGDEDELTPGRREAIGKGKGKAKMAREVDRI